jgi:type II secretory ATPase GspE/PulE/Tfp pilus assembly ATPase PilB-like protein
MSLLKLGTFGGRKADLGLGQIAAAAQQSPESAAPGAGILVDVSKYPAERAVEFLIEQAVRIHASDLFICAQEQHYAVQVRHHGIIRPLSIVTAEEGKRMVAYVRNNSGADVNEKRKPADGRWIYRGNVSGNADGDDNDGVDLRINFLPTLYGEDIAMRLLVRGHELFKLEQLGMEPDQFAQYAQMVESPSGLVLITGPTGSGKTATLYATLLRLNDGRRKINTIEDPVEYSVGGIHQSQTNPAIDLTFAEVLRAVLRQSPDVIMIGEIRDEETAKIAVRAANSGTLVLGTLHAPDAAMAVQSMRGYGVPSHFLATSLRGVVSQRLVRTLDADTRVGFDLDDAPETFSEVKDLLREGEGKTLYAPGPAEKNQMSGYSGRTGVFEVLAANKAIRALIAEGAPADAIRAQARADRMIPFRLSALLKVARGITSAEELFRVIPTEQLVNDA